MGTITASRTQAMTSKERLEAALLGEATDHLPFAPLLAYFWEAQPESIRNAGQLDFHHRIGADPLHRGAPCVVSVQHSGIEKEWIEEKGATIEITKTPVGTLRQAHRKSDQGNTHFLIEHPLKTEEDFLVQLWIEEHLDYTFDPTAALAHLHEGDGREGLSIGMLLPHGKSAYQRMIEHLVGTEELTYALCDFPETVDALHAAIVANHMKAVELSCQGPYEYFLTWEDSSTQNYSPQQYEQYIASEIEEWCTLLGQHGKRYIQHACGHVKALLPHMRQQGIAAIESIVTPPTGNVSLHDAREMLGASVAIIGGIEPILFLEKTIDELGDYVETVIDAGRGGPFILANSDSCPPGVTIEKFARVAEIARQTPGD